MAIGLVTDGRWWALVWAPRGGTVGAGIWDADTWGADSEALRAFVALLGRAWFLAVADDDRLSELLEESLGAQEQVTEALGRQVRDAVEVLLETWTGSMPATTSWTGPATTRSTTAS